MVFIRGRRPLIKMEVNDTVLDGVRLFIFCVQSERTKGINRSEKRASDKQVTALRDGNHSVKSELCSFPLVPVSKHRSQVQ